jgi:hypothetical protein
VGRARRAGGGPKAQARQSCPKPRQLSCRPGRHSPSPARPPAQRLTCPPPPPFPLPPRPRSFASPDIAFACGGSGSLFKSADGGKTWKRDKSTDNVAGNLYSVHFFGGKGYILGNGGILLRYIGNTPNSA